jgi:type IV secretory pathway VirB10-like protein
VIHAKSSEVSAGKEEIVKPKDEVVVDKPKQSVPRPPVSDAFLSSTQSTSKFSSRPWKLAAVFAALVLIVAGIAVPWGWRVRGKAARAAQQQSPALNEAAAQPQTSQSTDPSVVPSDVPSNEATAAPANTEAADAARREREARAREEAKLRAKTSETTEPATTTPAQSTPAASSASAAQPASGPKKAVVQVTYDENGRVTQASGNDPTALRIARQKRFPPGKAGSATITIPIN